MACRTVGLEMNFEPVDDDVEGDHTPSMPCFECSNAEDRPFAPPAEDYPIGCEVELRDVEFARLAQESGRWEPFMEEVFAVPRRRVKVCRHAGEYTFVLCNDMGGFELVGCTLYRACLSEPKVKTTKFYSNLADRHGRLEELPPGEKDMGRGLFEDVAPPWRTGEAPFAEEDATPPPSVPALEEEGIGAVEPPSPGEGASDPARHRHRFAVAMIKGTQEIHHRNYEKALRYYDAALAEAPEEEMRVRSSRSVALLLLGRTVSALNDAKRVIELAPESHLGYVRAGNVLRGTKLYHEAQSFYQEGLRRDPSNEVIHRLVVENCIAMFYDARTKRFPKFKIAYHVPHHRAQAWARQAIAPRDVFLRESTTLVSVLGPPGKGPGRRPVVCAYCTHPQMNEGEVCSHIPFLHVDFLRSLYSAPKWVGCNYTCGVVYCTEECRSKAWVEHHWLECPAHGRWRVGLDAMESFLDEYTQAVREGSGGGTTTSTTAENAAAAAGAATGGGGGVYASPPRCPAEDLSPEVLVACVRITARMLSRVLSGVWDLQDAVHIYDWLQVSPLVESQRAHSAELLSHAFALLSQGFLREERRRLTYALFERCYERARSNVITLYVSSWQEILIRAESHAALIESALTSTSPARTASKGAMPAPSVSPSTAKSTCLQNILRAPPHGVPGTYATCLCLFELFAMTLPTSGAAPLPESAGQRTRPPGARPIPAANVALQTSVEPSARIHLRSTTEVEKNAALVSVWPPYLFHSTS